VEDPRASKHSASSGIGQAVNIIRLKGISKEWICSAQVRVLSNKDECVLWGGVRSWRRRSCNSILHA
jgi:hypothetical protein